MEVEDAAESLEEEQVDEEESITSDEDDNLAEFEVKDIIPAKYSADGCEHTEDYVNNLSSHNTRPLIKIRISRKRRDFAHMAPKFITYEPTNPTPIPPSADASFKPENFRKVIEIGLQAGCGIQLIPQPKGMGFQSTYFRTSNARVEFDPVDFQGTFSQINPNDITEVPQLESFVRNVELSVEQALQSNETIDVFHDEFEILGSADADGKGGLSSFMNEIRTFRSMEYSVDKTISDVRWVPGNIENISASSINNYDFNKRTDNSGTNIPGSIVIWTFEEFANTKIVLKASQEVLCFDFHPIYTNIVVGGMITGQVAMWDMNLLGDKSKEVLNPGQTEAPELLALVSSAIYDSHKGPVMDLSWLPDKVRIERKNLCAYMPEQEACTQIATLSEDGLVLIWETHFTSDRNPYKIHDYQWQPLIRMQLTKPEIKTDVGGSKIFMRKDSTNSQFWCTTDGGELLSVDWIANSIDETRPEFVKKLYPSDVTFRPAVALKVSPFYPDIVLTVHDFHFCIWKESCDQPIFQSYYSDVQYSCGEFSPARPAVIFIGRADGRVDMWDFLDQSHQESLHHGVTSTKLTTMRFVQVKKNQYQMAIGDAIGIVHIMEITRHISQNLEREKRSIAEFWQKEEQRVTYYEDRFSIRADEANRMELQGL